MAVTRASREVEETSDPPFISLFFAGIWFVYLYEPLTTAWRMRQTAAGLVGLATVLAFAAVYLWHFHRARAFSWSVSDPATWRTNVRGRWLRYALCLALAVNSVLTLGQVGTATWVFLAVTGLWTFSTPVAFGLAAVIAVVYEFLAFHVTGWERDSSASVSIVLAVCAVGGGMIASRRARDLSAARRENARLLVEEERNRMARDLHDILGHSLTVITVKAELAGRLLEVDPHRAKGEVESLEGLAREALADVRRAVEGFREISLSGELARAREALTAAGITADLPRAVDQVPAGLHEVYAWTVREAVTNVIRHSGATSCSISLRDNELRVTDDGTGSAGNDGNGLRGLADRAREAGLQLMTKAVDPRGFEVAVLVPSPVNRMIDGAVADAALGTPRPNQGAGSPSEATAQGQARG